MPHEIIMLHESSNVQIYKCKCCNHYNLNYRNLFLAFSRKEFKGFYKILSRLRPEHFTCIHPEGLKAIVSHSKYPGRMGFTEEEVTSILSQIEEAMMMEEVQKTLTS